MSATCTSRPHVAFSLLERYFLLARPHTRAHRLIHTSGAAKSPDSNGDDSDGANKRKGGRHDLAKPRAAKRGTLALLKQSRPGRKARAAGCGGLHSSSPSVPQYAGMRPFASETCEMRTQPSTCGEISGDMGRYGEMRTQPSTSATNTQGSGCEGGLVPRSPSLAGGRRCREHSGVLEQRTCPLREC